MLGVPKKKGWPQWCSGPLRSGLSMCVCGGCCSHVCVVKWCNGQWTGPQPVHPVRSLLKKKKVELTVHIRRDLEVGVALIAPHAGTSYMNKDNFPLTFQKDKRSAVATKLPLVKLLDVSITCKQGFLGTFVNCRVSERCGFQVRCTRLCLKGELPCFS